MTIIVGRRIPHGMCGLKCESHENMDGVLGRIPHGMCGLKSFADETQFSGYKVASLTGCVD